MKREWRKYINGQKYSECQLVSAINAYCFLTGKTISQNSKEYESMVDLCYARNGAAIRIDRIYKLLGIKIKKTENSIYVQKWTKDILPVEFNVWHKKYGFHSTLIVDCCQKSKTVRITNFAHETSMEGWMFIEDLYKFATNGKGKIPSLKFFELEIK